MKYHLKQKLLSLHHKIEIFDESDVLAYSVSSKAISIHDTTTMVNAAGEVVATFKRKPITIHEKHTVEMADGTTFEVSTELFHVLKDVIRIDALGWELRGKFLEHDYSILDENENTLATAHKKWVSLHDVFEYEIFDNAHSELILALFVVLDHIICDRIATSTMAGISSGNTAHAEPPQAEE